jgi:hypothetical protein
METSMNLLEFKRRLMTDPHSRDPEFVAARAKGGEFARAAAEADAFERQLHKALDVPMPKKLAENIILRQSMEPTSRLRSAPRYLAVAAALVMAVAISTIIYLQPGTVHENLHEHLAWHWEMDGPATLALSERSPSDENHIRRVFSELGVHLDHELLANVRLTKFCPTPDGAGVHAVLATEDGPVTLFYMPRTSVPGSPRHVTLADGMEGWMVDLPQGSMALIAEAGRDTSALVEDVRSRLSFSPGLSL